MSAIVECVPNFSEGRDPTVIAALAAAITSVAGAHLLAHESDLDHHRSVFTIAGNPDAVSEAAFRAVAKAAALINLTRHSGVHPRIGAADVVPFVPIRGITLAECARLAHRLGERIWSELQIPVYFYEAAALHADRIRLEEVRRGGFENPARPPDLGGPQLHPGAGAVIIGARKFLLAFNINLATADVEIARRIARKIRASSGGFPHVKAMGVPLPSRGLAQVSMNLTDYEVTPLHVVFEAVRGYAAEQGVSIAGSEIIGLMPAHALASAAGHFLHAENYRQEALLEDRLLANLINSNRS